MSTIQTLHAPHPASAEPICAKHFDVACLSWVYYFFVSFYPTVDPVHKPMEMPHSDMAFIYLPLRNYNNSVSVDGRSQNSHLRSHRYTFFENH